MTTSVTVKTRAHGASGSVGAEAFEMGPNQERRFDTSDTLSLSLRQLPAEDPVPGSEQNDEFIKEVDTSKLDERSGKSNAEKSSAKAQYVED
jgi:hypothetical protein